MSDPRLPHGDNPSPRTPRGSWIRERDGDLNPTLLLMTVYALLGVVINGVVLGFALRGDSGRAWVLVPALLLFDLLVMVVCAIGWYQLGRAKLVANSRVLAKGVEALGEFAQMDRDERDDEQRALDH